ncbi:MAG: aldo/keto reductase, partial [Deltaproteobacteria bacterium]|nr:aldo/keto reductase [Deltaproteobacteria bacterium]
SFCRKNSIVLTAYAPLGSADRPARLKKDGEPSLLSNPVIAGIAEKHGITAGQALLRWGLQRETVVIPKSVNPDRLRENLAAAEPGPALDGEDIAAIATLDLKYRYVDGSFWTPPKSPYTIKELWDE